VVPLAREEAVRRDLDGDDCVAAAARALLAFASEADPGPVLEAPRKLQVDRLAVAKRDALRLQRDRVDERDLEPVGHIRAFLRTARPLPEAAERTPRAPASAGSTEQSFEQV